MKKILIILVFTLILACTPKSIINDQTKNTTIRNIGTFYYNKYQIDSMCIADTLPNIDYWEYIGQRDYETKNIIDIYFFLKQDSLSNKDLLYRAIKNDSIYKLTKRLTE